MKCFVCEIEVNKEDERFMFPIETPYMNLFIHLKCWRIIKDTYLNDANFHQKLLTFINSLPKVNKKH
jgi:hypothetical protein